MQNAITLAQKEDAELCIIEGIHNLDPEHEINNISNTQYKDQNSNTGPCHGCNGLHLTKDCKNSVCKKCKPILDNDVPARCPRRKSPTKQQWLNPLYNSPLRNQPYGYSDPNLQLSIYTSKPDHISELQSYKKMTRYFKKSHKNNESHQVNNNIIYPHIIQNSSLNQDKHVSKKT